MAPQAKQLGGSHDLLFWILTVLLTLTLKFLYGLEAFPSVEMIDAPWNAYRRGRLRKIDLLIKIGCFTKKKNAVSVDKSGNTKGGSIIVLLTSCLTGLD